jgi:hypothetical protein
MGDNVCVCVCVCVCAVLASARIEFREGGDTGGRRPHTRALCNKNARPVLEMN